MKPIMCFVTGLILTLVGCDSPTSLSSDTDARILAQQASLKVLAIGNSFTDNATLYIPQLLAEFYTPGEIFFANAVQGGSSLEQHWSNHINHTAAYTFRYAESGAWIESGACDIDAALEFAPWDIVVIQQVSGLSGIQSSYSPYLTDLVSLIRSYNDSTLVGWQMTWAYAPTSTHPDFYRYGNNYNAMADSISRAVENCVLTHNAFVIPSGLVIDSLRASGYDDPAIYYDGFHLLDGLPCYALSCLWHESVIAPYTHQSCFPNSVRPGNPPIGANDAALVRRIVTDIITTYPHKIH